MKTRVKLSRHPSSFITPLRNVLYCARHGLKLFIESSRMNDFYLECGGNDAAFLS